MPRITGDLWPSFIRILSLFYLAEIPLFAFVLYESVRGPYSLIQSEVGLPILLVAELGLIWILVGRISVSIETGDQGISVRERRVGAEPEERIVPWADLRSITANERIDVFTCLNTSDPLRTVWMTTEQAKVVVKDPRCPRLDIPQEVVRRRLGIGPLPKISS